MFIKRNIPNAITLGNLLCGCLALVKAFEGDLVWAAYLVGIAAVLDFFDGFAARLLGVSSPIGKDLDSLADMVTFGVVPGVMMFKVIIWETSSIYLSDIFVGSKNDSDSYLPYIAFLIPLFSAVRLARFNNDLRQSDSFIGLPTPANAVFFASFPLVFGSLTNTFSLPGILANISSIGKNLNSLLYITVGIVVIQSFLLVAPLPLFALKFKNFGWKGNEIRYAFLVWSLLLLIFLKFIGIPLVILSYILFSVVNNLLSKKAE